MKKLWNKVKWSNPKIKVFAFIVIMVFTFSLASFKSGGNRPLFFFKIIKGNVISVKDYARFNPSRHGPATSSKCMSLFLNTHNSRIINRDKNLSKLFYQGQEVKLWIYKTGYDYNFVQAVEGNKMLIKHNEIKGWVIFVLLIISGVCFVFCLYLFVLRK